MDGMMTAVPVGGLGLDGSAAVSAAASSPATVGASQQGQAFFPTGGGRSFFRSAEFGLLLGLAAVVYIDGRVLPRKR